MKDAIIVRKETGSFSTKEMIGEKEMKRQLELFLIILLPILGLVFLGGKIMHLTKRPEQKITASSSKKVVQKSEEELKKALGEALNPITERLQKIEDAKNGEGELTDEEKKKKEEEAAAKKKVKKEAFTAEDITKAVQEAVAPLNEKVETLEKARFSNNQEQNYTEQIEKEEDVFGSLFSVKGGNE